MLICYKQWEGQWITIVPLSTLSILSPFLFSILLNVSDIPLLSWDTIQACSFALQAIKTAHQQRQSDASTHTPLNTAGTDPFYAFTTVHIREETQPMDCEERKHLEKSVVFISAAAPKWYMFRKYKVRHAVDPAQITSGSPNTADYWSSAHDSLVGCLF